MPDLIAPQGGLTEPVCCTVSDSERDEFMSEAGSLTKVPVSAADLSAVYRFGDGTLSPLTGPMNSLQWKQVLEDSTITHEGKKYAWTIPIAFPLSDSHAKNIRAGQKVALTSPAGQIVAIVDVTDVYAWDKMAYLKGVYGTDRIDHPGADMVLKNDEQMTHLLGGTIKALPQPKNKDFGQYVLTPREVRAKLAATGWDAAVAFQTRNPLHRAHEYALVYALEELIRAGRNAGAVLNPLIGETKGDDVNAAIRMQTYEKLIETRGLGEGDSDESLWHRPERSFS